MICGVRAVVFDFFGTLTYGAPAAERRAGAHRVGSVLGVDPERFEVAMRASWAQRCTGAFGDLADTLAAIARRVGGSPMPEQLARACAMRRELERAYVRLRPEAVGVVRALRERGMRTGLVSDCTHELCECWTEVAVAPYLEATAFSVLLGVKKPDPRIYQHVCDELGVRPADCLYVGDGGSNELRGASAAGMRAVQIVCADHAEQLVYDPEVDWRGEQVANLNDLLTLV